MDLSQAAQAMNESEVKEQAIQMIINSLNVRHKLSKDENEQVAEVLFDEFAIDLGDAILKTEQDLSQKDDIQMEDIESVVQKHGPEVFLQRYQTFLQQIAEGVFDEKIREILTSGN